MRFKTTVYVKAFPFCKMMMIKLLLYIFHDGQCKLFAAERVANLFKESDPSRPTDRTLPSTSHNDERQSSRNFVPLEYIHDFPRENHIRLPPQRSGPTVAL